MKNNFSIVIPIYNEFENIKLLVSEIKAALQNSYKYEVIIVDDCSRDKTQEILSSSFFFNCKVIRHNKNFGQSASIRTGVLNSKFDNIITLDGDLQNDPNDIPRLINIFQSKETNYDLVGGIRKKRMDNFVKRASSIIANFVRKSILNDNCDDTGCGLKIFTKKIFLELPFFNGIHRFLPALYKGYGYNTYFIKVNHRMRNAGSSNYGTLSRLFLGIVDLVRVKKIINQHNRND